MVITFKENSASVVINCEGKDMQVSVNDPVKDCLGEEDTKSFTKNKSGKKTYITWADRLGDLAN